MGTEHNTSIVKDCRNCCLPVETKKETVQYAAANLEVCKGRLYHFPEVKDFLNKHAKSPIHKLLKVCRRLTLVDAREIAAFDSFCGASGVAPHVGHADAVRPGWIGESGRVRRVSSHSPPPPLSYSVLVPAPYCNRITLLFCCSAELRIGNRTTSRSTCWRGSSDPWRGGLTAFCCFHRLFLSTVFLSDKNG